MGIYGLGSCTLPLCSVLEMLHSRLHALWPRCPAQVTGLDAGVHCGEMRSLFEGAGTVMQVGGSIMHHLPPLVAAARPPALPLLTLRPLLPAAGCA